MSLRCGGNNCSCPASSESFPHRSGAQWGESEAPRRIGYRRIMSIAPKVDPVDLAFDRGPEAEATEAETGALREARAEVEAGAAFIPHAEAMRLGRERFGGSR